MPKARGWHNPLGCAKVRCRGDITVWHPLSGGPEPCRALRCRPDSIARQLAEARTRLASFDVVGVLECTSSVLGLLSARMGWPVDEPRLELAVAQALRRRPHGITQGGALWRSANRWRYADALNASERDALTHAARCDGELYADGAARMRRHLAEPLAADYRAHVADHAHRNESSCARLLPGQPGGVG
eukprot:6573034-Prymnesium_polylepis.1